MLVVSVAVVLINFFFDFIANLSTRGSAVSATSTSTTTARVTTTWTRRSRRPWAKRTNRPRRSDRLGPLFWVCVGFLGLNMFGAIFASLLPLPNPLFGDYNALNVGPSLHHLLGTDDLGRDIFARIVFGSRVSMAVGTGSMVIGFGVGAPLGMLAAYRRGRFDAILTSFMYVCSPSRRSSR